MMRDLLENNDWMVSIDLKDKWQFGKRTGNTSAFRGREKHTNFSASSALQQGSKCSNLIVCVRYICCVHRML